MNTRENFYVETAKFAFALVGGGTVGYFLARGANGIASKISGVVQQKVAAKVLATDGTEQENGLGA